MLQTKTILPKSFKDRFSIKIAIPFLFMILIVSSAIPTHDANALQTTDCFGPVTSNVGPNYFGPIVIDSYWVDAGIANANSTGNNPTKKEVGPGEGAAVFAVVMNNRGNLPITSITAFLALPSGFTPTGESSNPQLHQQFNIARSAGVNPAVASYYGQVQPGSTFTLFFNVNIGNNAKVGTYSASVITNYFILSQLGTCNSALLDVPLVLPGKVILDASTETTNISPQTNDPITISIQNKGSADATGVIASIVNLGNSKGGTSSGSGGSVVLSTSTTQLVNLGASTFTLGTIPAHSEAKINTVVFPSSSAGGSTQEVQLQISYENAWGKLQSTVISTGLVVSPNAPQSLSLSYLGNATTPIITAGNLDNLNFAVSNNSTDQMSNIVISLVPQSTSVSIVGPSTWSMQNLNPGDKQILSTQVFAANTLINTPASFTLTANYNSKGQSQTNSLTLGAFVIGNIKLQLYQITATTGSGSSISGNVLNQGSTTGLFSTLQMVPSPLTTAIREARLANFTNSTNGDQSTQSDQGSQGQGGGFQAQGQAFQGQGGQGFQGQGGQGFQGQGGQGFQGQGGGRQRGGFGAIQQQFLGDLTPDSPIPFSIPVAGLNLLRPGMYPVAFKVTYADDLKNFHTVILNSTVLVGRTQTNVIQQSNSIFDQIPIPVIIGIGIAVAVGIAYLIKRKRSSNKKLKMLSHGESDIVSIFGREDKKENES